MTHLTVPHAGVSTGLTQVGVNEPLTTGASIYIPFDTILYDRTETANLAEHGVNIPGSGLYLVTIQTILDTSPGVSGFATVLPQLVGTGGAATFTQCYVDYPSTRLVTFTWLIYMATPAPNVLVAEVDSNLAGNMGIASSMMTVAQIG